MLFRSQRSAERGTPSLSASPAELPVDTTADTLEQVSPHCVEAFHAVLQRERARANRNGHTFSVILFAAAEIMKATPTSQRGCDPLQRLLRVLTRRVRSIDEVGWMDQQRLGLVLPYTSAEAAWGVADEICQRLSLPAGQPTCRVYTYPTEWECEHVSAA